MHGQPEQDAAPGTGPDDRGLSPDDLFAEAEADADDKAEKGRVDADKALAPWTVGEAGRRLFDRLEREGRESPMAWPGCAPGWPPVDGRDAPQLRDGEPPRVEPWNRLWRMVGPPRTDWLAVLVGPTGRGKSGWALTMAEAVAGGGTPVLVMSCEMGADELLARLVSLRAPQPAPAWRDVLRGAVKRNALAEAVAQLDRAAPALYLWAPDAAGRTPKALADMVRHLTVKHGTTPLVVLDYVQRLALGEDRRVAVADLSGKLRGITRPGKDYPGCAMLVLSSTARSNYEHFNHPSDLLRAHRGGYKYAGETRNGERWDYKPPVPLEGMGKESGELEYDAPVVLCLTCEPPPETDRPGRPAQRVGALVVAKNRAGPTGWAPVWFDGPTGRWVEGGADARMRVEEAAPRERPGKKETQGETLDRTPVDD